MSDEINHNNDLLDEILPHVEAEARERFSFRVGVSTLQERLAAIQQLFGGQAQMSEAIGVSVSAIKSWISRGTEPGLLKVAKLSEISGASLDYVATGAITNQTDVECERGRLQNYKRDMYSGSNPLLRDATRSLFNEAMSSLDQLIEGQDKSPRTSVVANRSSVDTSSFLDGWLLDELGKIVVREHRSAGVTLLPEKVAPEAGDLYNQLLGMVRDITDQRTVTAMLPLLAENLRERLRSASAEPGAGKREAS